MRKRIWDRKRAKELFDQGMPVKKIHDIINLEGGYAKGSEIGLSTIQYALYPSYYEKKVKAQNSLQQAVKQKNIKYKGGSCQMTGDEFPGGKCEYNKCNGALAFHHLIQEDKSFAISNARHLPWKILEPELDKCILLCSNCHSEVHAGLHSEVMEAFIKEYKESVRPFLTPAQLVKGSPEARGNSILPKIGMLNGELVIEKPVARKDLKLNAAGTAYCDSNKRRNQKRLQEAGKIDELRKEGLTNHRSAPRSTYARIEKPVHDNVQVVEHPQRELWEDISYGQNQHEKILR
jgi:hypothetical protein